MGLAFKPSEKLTLTFDLAYTFWSSFDSIMIEIDTTTASGSPPPGGGSDELVVNGDWEDILRISVGGLYQVSDPWQVCFGLFRDPSPIPDETFSPLFLDIGDKYSFNIGTALTVSGVEFGYNFEYIIFSSREIEPGNATGDELDNYPGKYESDLVANHLSITYRF